MTSRLWVAGTLAAAVAVGACSSLDDGAITSDTTSSPSASSAPELPEITFEPCAEIDDAALTRWGFTPTTRVTEDTSIGTRELKTCTVDGYDRSLNLIAQNRPWNELPSTLSGPTVPILVNGREAIHAIDAMGTPSCTILMRTGFGAVIVDVAIYRRPDSPPNLDACDGIIAIAETIESHIDS